MRHALVFGIIVAALAGGVLAAQGQRADEVQFKAAQHKEEVEGDLNGAIALYQTLAQSRDRALAARALVRMAECHEKLGQAEARTIYERIVREFSDQRDAVAVARLRLTGTATRAGIVTRQVLSADQTEDASSISPDGRYLTHVLRDGTQYGDLVLHDFLTGHSQRLTSNASAAHPTFPDRSVIAPDGKRVAYAWWDNEGGGGFRIIDLSGTVLHSIDWSEDVGYLDPHDWSADGKWIAVHVSRPGLRQIGLVNAATGAMQVLKSVGWRDTTRMFFSPDSKYLAFDLSPDDDVDQHDVFVLAVDGSRESTAVVDPSMDTLVGWAPDGARLLFASDRTGSNSLWAQALRDGRPQGAPQLVKSDIGHPIPVGITRTGVFYYSVSVVGQAISMASVDFEAAKLLSPPTLVVKYEIGSHRQPSWSRDGRYIAYATWKDRGGPQQPVLTIQSVETGQVRQVRPRLAYMQTPNWSPDSSSFVAQATDTKGRQGIHRIDPHSGATELIAPRAVFPLWAPDGKRIFYTRAETQDVVERDLASGTERVVAGLPRASCRPLSLSVSPDGRQLAAVCSNPATKRHALTIVPSAGGTAREVIDADDSEWTSWTPDGRWILFARQARVWVVSPAGGAARAIDFGGNEVRGLRIQPGGNKVVFWYNKGTRRNPQEGVYAMEQFLPQ